MLLRASEGNVMVLYASGSDVYNACFYTKLIRFNCGQAAYDPCVFRQIRSAGLLFIAGGDQYRYYQFPGKTRW